MNILITGANGFIGRHLVERLVESNHLYCLVRSGKSLPNHPNVHVIEQDLLGEWDEAKLPKLLDVILNLAQSRHFRQFPEMAMDVFQVNTAATVKLLELGRRTGIRIFVHASSGGVCGYKPKPILESDPPNLINFYQASKFAAESFINAYGDFFNVVILRFYFVYGEGQRNMFIPDLIERVLKGHPIILFGHYGIRVNPIYVSDVVEATIRFLNLESNEIINVAGGEVTTIRELSEMIGKMTNRTPLYLRGPDRGVMNMVGSIEKMQLKLGFNPVVTLQEGLRRTIRGLGERQ